VQWRNPVVGVAAVITEADVLGLLGPESARRGQWDPEWDPAPALPRVLLARRAASFRGAWCLPCGYVEYDEEVREALVREIGEETGLRIRVAEIVAVLSNFHEPDKQSVGIWFRAVPAGGSLRPGDDVDAVGFFDPASPPPLAFPTDAEVLRSLSRSSG
jgi:ADP-ribose pyrophosphatase YjhB (NUDIX family)